MMKKSVFLLFAIGFLVFCIRTEQDQPALEGTKKEPLVKKEKNNQNIDISSQSKKLTDNSNENKSDDKKETTEKNRSKKSPEIEQKEPVKNTQSAQEDTKDSDNSGDTKDVSDSERFLIDEIVCTVYGPERTQIFCASDRERAEMGGGNQQSGSNFDKTMGQVVNELIYQDALRYKVPIDDSVIHTYIDSVRRQQGWSLEDITAVFKASGYYSFQDGFEQLRIMYAVNAMIDGKIKQSLVVTEAEVIAYYNEHPVFEEESYKIQVGLIPFNKKQSIKDQITAIKEYIKTAKGNIVITWNTPFWLKKSEMAEQLYSLMTMNPGDISEPQQVSEGFEVYKLLKKKPTTLIPLKKRYREIVELLRKPKFEKLYENYKKSLVDSASIVYFDAK